MCAAACLCVFYLIPNSNSISIGVPHLFYNLHVLFFRRPRDALACLCNFVNCNSTWKWRSRLNDGTQLHNGNGTLESEMTTSLRTMYAASAEWPTTPAAPFAKSLETIVRSVSRLTTWLQRVKLHVLVWGECTHAFHMHCLRKWLDASPPNRHQCPMDRRTWGVSVFVF